MWQRLMLLGGCVAGCLWQSYAQEAQCRLAYQVEKTDAWELWADDTLVAGEGYNVAPSWSPEQRQVVFGSTQDGNWELYLTSVENPSPQRLTFTEEAIELDPVWSPDGRYIAYDTNVDGNWELHLLEVATGQEERLTEHPANDINAAWSPDGAALLFQSDRTGLWQIYRLELATRSLTRLSDGDDFDPLYAPDGSQIVFRSVRDTPDGSKSAIYLMNADGLARLSEIGINALNPVWSADGTYLAYQLGQEIVVYELATGQTQTQNGIAPTWLCERHTVVYSAEGDLWAWNIASGEIEQLTATAALERDPLSYPSEENASRREALPPKYTGGD